MPWILFLEPFTECAQSVRIRTDTTLDQDCVLKATVQVCTACKVVSMLTTCMNFNTPFYARFASQTRKKARLPTQSVQASQCSKRLASQPGPEKASALSLSSSRVIGLCLGSKVVRQNGESASIHEISYCLLLLPCSLPLLIALALLFLCWCLRVCNPVTRSIRGEEPPSCSGVCPWSCRLPILQFEQQCSTEAMIGFFQYLRNSFPS